MSVKKHIKFAAPYRSQTFNTLDKLLIGRNGVVTGGDVKTSSGIATIQPMVFVQNGLLVEVDSSISATIPGTLTAPYFIAVSVSSAVENPSEVITPVFVKRPQDVSVNTVLVAEWDGQEWINTPRLQIDELLYQMARRTVKQDFVGVADGFDSSYSAGNILLSPGSLFDRNGELFTKTLSSTYAVTAADSDFSRVDQLIFRRPLDSVVRAGTIQYMIGNTYDGANQYTQLSSINFDATALPKTSLKTLVGPDNTKYYIWIEELGINARVRFNSLADGASVMSGVTDLATGGVSNFDAVYEPGGTIGLVYAIDTAVYYRKFDLAGSPLAPAVTVSSGATTLDKPKIVSVNSSGSYFLHVVYQEVTSPVVYKFYYARLSSVSSIETAPVLFVDLTDKIDNPSLEKDDDDALFFLSFENLSTGRVYLRQYLADTATSSTAPVQLGSPIEVADDVYSYPASTVLPIGGASHPKVVRSSNKALYVFFKQNKGAGLFGVGVYAPHFASLYGHKAILKDLVVSGENFDSFDVALDLFNTAHLIAVKGTTAVKATLDLENLSVGLTATVTTDAPTVVGTVFDAKGSLFHSWATPASNLAKTAKATSGVFTNLRSFRVTASDIHIAHYRTDDNVVAVVGRSIEEMPAISRLYELFNSVLGGSGQIAWNVLGTGVLSFASPIKIRMFNRVSEYTIAPIPAGITINDGEIAYVIIPDDDTPATVPLLKVVFGDGILDRYGKRAVPIFWNIGGDLYIRFAPFRLSNDQHTVIIGESISQQLVDFIGAVNTTPDPNAHAYVSTNYILQTDSHELAIGKLDLEIATVASAVAAFLAATALEETQTVGVGGTTIFNCAGFLWDADASKTDIQVYVNGIKMQQDVTGGLGEDFRKTSSSQLEFSFIVPEDSKITVRRQSVTIQPAQEEELIVGPGGTTTFTASTFDWIANNAAPDIQVFVNGVKYIQDQSGGLTQDFRKTSTTTLQFTNTVTEGSRILVRLERNTSGVGAPITVTDEGTTIATSLARLDFVGGGVTAALTGINRVQVTIPGAGGGSENIQKSVYNNTGVTIPALSVLEWESDGSVGLADADSFSTADFAGINLTAIPHGAYGQVVKAGNVSNALTGLGAAPGQEVFMSAAAGGFTLTPPTGITQTVFKLGVAEPPSAFATPNANDLFIELQVISTP